MATKLHVPTPMNEPTNLPRVYGEQDIGRILKRATELQHDEPTAPTAAGMTLAELEEVAAEAGIDPTFLRRAALEVDTGVADTSFWAGFAGEELHLIREVTLPGELGDDGFERIVAAIHSRAQMHGTPTLLGRTMTWQAHSPSKSRTVQIVVTSRGGETKLRLEENLSQMAAGLFTGMLTGFGAGLGLPMGLATQTLFGILFVPIGITALTHIGTRAIYRAIVKKRRRAIADLFERTVEEARASIDESTLTSGQNDGPAQLGAGESS